MLDKLGVLVIPDAFALGMAHEAFESETGLRHKEAAKAVIQVGVALSRTAGRLLNKG